tara:strand:+ start:569 stop:760 length:192 start_codon:yes stop_codon:yes gene_type:complete
VLQVRRAPLGLLVLPERLVPLVLQAQVVLVPLALLALARAGLLVVRGVACHFPPIFFSFPNDE